MQKSENGSKLPHSCSAYEIDDAGGVVVCLELRAILYCGEV